VLGQPGVATLFGGSSLSVNPFSGGRFTGGVWFESSYTCGFEGSYFFLAERSAAGFVVELKTTKQDTLRNANYS